MTRDPDWRTEDWNQKAPFVWYGGKRKVASEVWQAFGDVDNYVEPFAGSLAVLLGRPATHKGECETVNDKDAYIANFWRGLNSDPQDVCSWCDWPVNETDLMARHYWLVTTGRERIARMEADPDFYDAKVAGWWVWGINAWIGSGWCSGDGPWRVVDGVMVDVRKLPHLGDRGKGVNRKLPHLGNRGQDKPSRECDNDALIAYFEALAARLRRVRVCCGDWARVVTTGALSLGGTVGVFLDPPYDTDIRDAGCYNTDGEHGHISAAVREWAIANGDDPRLRIALCGYEGEHEMPDSWRVHSYSANACYQTSESAKTAGGNAENRHKERIWFNRHCRYQYPAVNGELFGDSVK